MSGFLVEYLNKKFLQFIIVHKCHIIDMHESAHGYFVYNVNAFSKCQNSVQCTLL